MSNFFTITYLWAHQEKATPSLSFFPLVTDGFFDIASLALIVFFSFSLTPFAMTETFV